MKSIWSVFVDRVRTNHPSAAVKIDGDILKVVMSDLVIVAEKSSDSHRAHSVTVGDKREEYKSLDDAANAVMDALNAIWAANQKPRTTMGGPSSSGGGGDDLADAVGDTYIASDDDDDD